ncbi:MAG: hypothetical protein ACI90V_007445 [Bacillariaceae sp.]|jgi:hypothetical protein
MAAMNKWKNTDRKEEKIDERSETKRKVQSAGMNKKKERK